MNWRDQIITPAEDAALSVSIAFLRDRLLEVDTITWALGLGAADKAKKLAILRLLAYPQHAIAEPWRSAWRLIEQLWDQSRQPDPGQAHALSRRIAAGETSGALVAEIADLLTPRIKLAPGAAAKGAKRRRPRIVEDLLSVQISGERLVKPSKLGIQGINDVPFLIQLLDSLSQRLNSILSLAARLGWEMRGALYRLGGLNRVYGATEADDPDEYGRGIASLIKVMDAALRRLSELSSRQAQSIATIWEVAEDAIHLRLWASAARLPAVVDGAILGGRLRRLPIKQFWDLHHFPEIAEARAVRFGDLSPADQNAIVRRLLRLPPASMWGSHSRSEEELQSAREYWAVRELRRIQTAGGDLGEAGLAWLEARKEKFPDLMGAFHPDEGYLNGPRAYTVEHHPDRQFDDLEGAERLSALENQLGLGRQSWEDDPAEEASAWISEGTNTSRLLEDFEGVASQGLAYPLIWARFGWVHPGRAGSAKAKTDEVRRVLRLLPRVDRETRAAAIDGLTHWISRAADIAPTASGLTKVWFDYWPDAVAATNAARAVDAGEVDIDELDTGTDEVEDIDTLNNPVGRLIGVFLSYIGVLKPPIFGPRSTARRMRDTIMSAEGAAAVIATRYFVENVQYFRYHDRIWTDAVLFPPLRQETREAVILWRGIARRTLYRDTLAVLSDEIVARISDPRLDRNSRRNLLFSVVVEALHALRQRKRPAIRPAKLQQLLRNVDDETRASGAEVLHRFVADMTKPKPGKRGSAPEVLFRNAAKPFLTEIWPQERSLTTPGVAKALADLPAVCGEAFAEAVDAIERFLVPFDCWSLLDYGLYGEIDDEPRLAQIDTPVKAASLLRLLDRTIGAAEGAVIPYDIGAALNRIRDVDEGLAASSSFRRLSAVARL